MSKTKQPKCTKAVGYVRVSTGKQDLSLEAQQTKLRTYCQLAGLELVEVIVERATSGKVHLADRPEGQRVAELVQAGVCHIVAIKLDRLFRNAADALQHVEEWQAAGISLHLVDMGGQSINTGSSMGKMLITMLAGFAEFERNLISERTSAALDHKKAQGEVYNHVPYGQAAKGGQRVNGKLVGAKLVANPTEQATIAKMQAWQAEGLSYGKIADKLNDLGIQAKQGGRWAAKAVWNVLQRAQQVAEPAQSAEQLGEQLDQQMRYGQAEQPQVAQFLGYDKQEA